MNDRRAFLIVEAVLLIGPLALLLAWAIPMILIALLFEVSSTGNAHQTLTLDKLSGYAGVIGGIIAFVILIKLVRRTIQSELFSFGVWFWIGIGFGAYATHYLYRITNGVTTGFVVIPAIILVAHFMGLQRQLSKSNMPESKVSG